MPKLLKLLDELEAALPDMRTALEGNGDYMEGEDELPPLPDEEMPEGEDEELPPMPEGEDDLESMPPLPMKKKKPLPF